MSSSADAFLTRRYGEWAVLTHASSGIGREIARDLAARGMRLLLVVRRALGLEQLKAELSARRQNEVICLSLDLSLPVAPAAVRAVAGNPNTGLLVKAASFGPGGNFLDHSPAAEATMVDLNCRPLLDLTHYFGSRFAAQRRGASIS